MTHSKSAKLNCCSLIGRSLAHVELPAPGKLILAVVPGPSSTPVLRLAKHSAPPPPLIPPPMLPSHPMRPILLPLLLLPLPALAGPLTGKTYIIELSSSQSASGYGDYLLPPLLKALAGSGMKPWKQLGPGADLVVNVVTDSDVGRWVGTGDAKAWIYTISATVGLSPEAYVIPVEGTPAFGVRAVLETPNPDREDEMACLIDLATRTALRNWKPEGMEQVDARACLRP